VAQAIGAVSNRPRGGRDARAPSLAASNIRFVSSHRSVSETLDGYGSTYTTGTTTAPLLRTLQCQKRKVVRLSTPAKEDGNIITAGGHDIFRRQSTPLTR